MMISKMSSYDLSQETSQVLDKSVYGLHKQHSCPENLSELGSLSKSCSQFEAGCRLERKGIIRASSEVSLSILTDPESHENSTNTNQPDVKKPEDFLKAIHVEDDVPRKKAARNFSCGKRFSIGKMILFLSLTSLLLVTSYYSFSKDYHKASNIELKLETYVVDTEFQYGNEGLWRMSRDLLQQVGKRNPSPKSIFRYFQRTGFVADLTVDEARKLSGLSGVVSVIPERLSSSVDLL